MRKITSAVNALSTLKKTVAAVAVSITATIIATLLTTGDLFVEVASWVWDGISWVWGMLQSSHLLPGWTIMILGLFALGGLILFIIGLLGLLFQGLKRPTYQSYTEDIIDGIRWRWSWTDNKINQPWCYCPICDAQLIHAPGASMDWGMLLICERCPSDGSLGRISPNLTRNGRGRVVSTVAGKRRNDISDPIEREIIRRIRTKSYLV